ncbi:hypothetical protein CMI37_32115, partial [Candidatus Pacearchaeota archaeon]|nr:hypothetical protein [Candidatus Pacearchaeota archaeon]
MADATPPVTTETKETVPLSAERKVWDQAAAVEAAHDAMAAAKKRKEPGGDLSTAVKPQQFKEPTKRARGQIAPSIEEAQADAPWKGQYSDEELLQRYRK